MVRSSVLVFVFIFVTDIWVHGVVKSHEGFTDGFTCANHRFQNCNGNCADHSSNGSLKSL